MLRPKDDDDDDDDDINWRTTERSSVLFFEVRNSDL
jgi:hypothetical protein